MVKCYACKRELIDPTSVNLGIGPVCRRKRQRKLNAQEKNEVGNSCGFYDGGDIILRRVNGYATANVPHAIVRHSPTGFEWGYGGSGPADLALNILYAVTGDGYVADSLYQQFKWDVIAKVPEEGGVIKRDEIFKWLEGKGIHYENSGVRR